MVEYFKVKSQHGQFQVYFQDNPQSHKSIIATFDSYLMAKIRAYSGNLRIANTEREFAESIGER